MKLPALCLALLAAAPSPVPVQTERGAGEPRRGPAPVDAFHPERDEEVVPAWGGSVSVHLFGQPQNLCYPIENTSYTRWMLYELHENLLQRDWETWEYEPVLATGWDTEDGVVLAGGKDLYGRLEDRGEAWRIEPVSPANPLTEPREVPKKAVEKVERATVYTFHLRDDVRWHDGHAFDAHDVAFSLSIYRNPNVDCDSIRGYYDKIERWEVIDEHTVRVFYAEQYFNVLDVFKDFCILPAHVYDLGDPDNPDHDPDATAEEQGAWINENPHNRHWIGLGPYRLTKWSPEAIEARRFPDYFDPENGGYLDRIRWRHIQNDNTALQALINGDIDFTVRITSDDYFGPATESEAFQEGFYKGYYYVGGFNYTAWNMRRPHLAELSVRVALAHCFDFDEYIRSVAHGLGKQVTGSQFYFGPAYNHEVEPFPFDLERAAELLAEAGWYDRDGNGLIDKDGVDFEIDYLMASGNRSGQLFTQKLQENLEQVGIRLNLVSLELASFMERVLDKDFDAVGLAWSLPIETDPEQLWHSKGAKPGVRGSNRSSVADPYVDELIEEGQRELDDERRHALWRELHRYLYQEVQPYLFRVMFPRKFAMNEDIRGMQTFAIDPGYSIRRWYYPAGTPGTRSSP